MISKNIATLEQWLESLGPLNLNSNEIGAAMEYYERMTESLDFYTPKTNDPESNIEITLGKFHDTGGSQWIAEGSIIDHNRKAAPHFNWHLQDTSQSIFMCGIVFDIRRRDFSMHT